jgi:hypothetical protein
MVLLYQSSEVAVTPKAGGNVRLGSDSHLKVTLLTLYSASSHTLLEAPSDYNTFCWCRVALRWTYNIIHTTLLRRMKGTNISRVGSRRRAWRRTLLMCWRKTTPLGVFQASKMGIGFRISWLLCQMIRLSGCGHYTLLRIWDGMTITNALSNTGVETLSKAWDGWCGSQPMLSISFTPLSVALTATHHQNASILKRTLRTGSGRHK